MKKSELKSMIKEVITEQKLNEAVPESMITTAGQALAKAFMKASNEKEIQYVIWRAVDYALDKVGNDGDYDYNDVSRKAKKHLTKSNW